MKKYISLNLILFIVLLAGTILKILKLKKAVSMLGGITKTVDKIYSKYKLYKSWNYRTTDAWKRAVKETGNTLSSDVRNAFLDFFNITNVIRACT